MGAIPSASNASGELLAVAAGAHVIRGHLRRGEVYPLAHHLIGGHAADSGQERARPDGLGIVVQAVLGMLACHLNLDRARLAEVDWDELEDLAPAGG